MKPLPLTAVCIGAGLLVAGCTSHPTPKQSRVFAAAQQRIDRVLAERTDFAATRIVRRPALARDAWAVTDVERPAPPTLDLDIDSEDLTGTAMGSEELLVARRNAARYGPDLPDPGADYAAPERVRLTLTGSDSLLELTNLDIGAVYMQHRLDWLNAVDGTGGLNMGPAAKETLRSQWQSALSGIQTASVLLREQVKVVKEAMSPEEIAAEAALYPETMVAPPGNTRAAATLAQQIESSFSLQVAAAPATSGSGMLVNAGPLRRSVGSLLQSVGAVRGSQRKAARK